MKSEFLSLGCCEDCGDTLRPTTAYRLNGRLLCETCYAAGLEFLRGRSVVDREPHKLLVGGSIPSPATNVSGKGAGANTVGRSVRNGFRVWPFRARNRRAHRLGRRLAWSHPQWMLDNGGPDFLDLALLLAALFFLLAIALLMF